MQRSQVVFVCEHGAALSVVSAAYFNKLALERHLNLRAIARGIIPQKDIAVSAREGLRADGVAFETKRPRALTRSDVAHALRIVTFAPLPAKYSKWRLCRRGLTCLQQARTMDWRVTPFSNT